MTYQSHYFSPIYPFTISTEFESAVSLLVAAISSNRMRSLPFGLYSRLYRPPQRTIHKTNHIACFNVFLCGGTNPQAIVSSSTKPSGMMPASVPVPLTTLIGPLLHSALRYGLTDVASHKYITGNNSFSTRRKLLLICCFPPTWHKMFKPLIVSSCMIF